MEIVIKYSVSFLKTQKMSCRTMTTVKQDRSKLFSKAIGKKGRSPCRKILGDLVQDVGPTKAKLLMVGCLQGILRYLSRIYSWSIESHCHDFTHLHAIVNIYFYY